MRQAHEVMGLADREPVERALTDIVTSCRIVQLSVREGGELQLYLRVDPALARAEGEIAARRARLERRAPSGSPTAWQKRLELAEIC